MDQANDILIEKIVDNLPAMIGYWDKNLINKYSNAAYFSFFAKDRNEILNMHIREVIGEELYTRNEEHFDEVLRGIPQSFERDIHMPTGEIKTTQMTFNPDFKNGEVVGFFAMVVDITEFKKIEREKEEIYKKLVNNSKMVALGEMAGGIAHEINNPLCIIGINAKNAKKILDSHDSEKEKIQKYLANIESTTNRIAKIVSGLRFFSRENHQGDLNEVTLYSILEETFSFCTEKLKHKGIELIEYPYDHSLSLKCCPTQISQVFLNLINNAIDAIDSYEQKWISIQIQEDEGFVKIIVSDSGKGIDPKIIDKLMQPFVTTKEVGKGTGLGLSVSRGIIESHKGKLLYEKIALNTTFTITLPSFKKKVELSYAI